MEKFEINRYTNSLNHKTCIHNCETLQLMERISRKMVVGKSPVSISDGRDYERQEKVTENHFLYNLLIFS